MSGLRFAWPDQAMTQQKHRKYCDTQVSGNDIAMWIMYHQLPYIRLFPLIFVVSHFHDTHPVNQEIQLLHLFYRLLQPFCLYFFRFNFKYALAYLLRGARHALHDILLLRTSAIRRRLYLGRRLDSHQDEFVLLATYRGGSLISFQDKKMKFFVTSAHFCI